MDSVIPCSHPMPAKKKIPAADFVAAARREFGYLVDVFGFEEDKNREKVKGPRTVCFSSPTQLVTVEGIPITSTVQVNVTVMASEGEEPVRLALPALVEMRAPGARLVAADLLAQLAHDAGLLRQHAADILKGDEKAKQAAEKLAEEIERAEKREKKHQQAQMQNPGVA